MENRQSRLSKSTEGTKQKGVLYYLTLILTVCITGMSAYVVYHMLKHNIFNFRFVNYTIFGVIAVIIMSLGVLLITKKAKRFAFGFSLITAALLGYATYSLNSGLGAFSKALNSATVTEEKMAVVVLAGSAIETVDALNDKQILAPTSSDNDNIQALLANVKQSKSVNLSVLPANSYAQAYQRLIAGEAQAMVLNTAHEGFLEEIDAGYASKIKKIYEFTVTKKVARSEENKPQSHTQQNEETFNVYLSGIDTYGSISQVSRSDVNIIMTVNAKTGKILLTTTPRDSYVRIADGGNNQYDKLTHAGIYGVDASVHTLENLYNIDINYYARINFTSFLKLIDLVGGIDVYNPQAFTSSEGVPFAAGTIHLNSTQALAFVRERYNLPNGDVDRAANQQKVITALIGQLTRTKNLINANSIFQQIATSVQTNMPIEKIMSLANSQAETGGTYQVTSQALVTNGQMGLPSYAMPGYNLYMGVVDTASLEEVKANIKSILSGE